MGAPTKANRNQAIEAAKKGRGRVSFVANALGVTPQTIDNYRKRWASFDQAMKDEFDNFDVSMVDKAEFKLDLAVMNGEAWAIKYTLSTKGKDRGYTERQEITGADGEKLEPLVIIRGNNTTSNSG